MSDILRASSVTMDNGDDIEFIPTAPTENNRGGAKASATTTTSEISEIKYNSTDEKFHAEGIDLLKEDIVELAQLLKEVRTYLIEQMY